MARFDPEVHHRRSVRLKGYDYGDIGAYFITICVKNRLRLFGEVRDSEMHLTDGGWVVGQLWERMASDFPGMEVDEFVVMPDHLHGILVIGRPLEGWVEEGTAARAAGRPQGTEPGTIQRALQVFKTASTYEYGFGVKHYAWPPFAGKLWQRSFYEHIIRGPKEREQIQAYIRRNPERWWRDAQNSDHVGQVRSDSGGDDPWRLPWSEE